MKKLRIISLVVLAITTFVSVDLLINLLGSLIPTMNDGIGVHSVIVWGNLYFGDNNWSLERFYDAFVISALLWLVILVENVVLTILDILKK